MKRKPRSWPLYLLVACLTLVIVTWGEIWMFWTMLSVLLGGISLAALMREAIDSIRRSPEGASIHMGEIVMGRIAVFVSMIVNLATAAIIPATYFFGQARIEVSGYVVNVAEVALQFSYYGLASYIGLNVASAFLRPPTKTSFMMDFVPSWTAALSIWSTWFGTKFGFGADSVAILGAASLLNTLAIFAIFDTLFLQRPNNREMRARIEAAIRGSNATALPELGTGTGYQYDKRDIAPADNDNRRQAAVAEPGPLAAFVANFSELGPFNGETVIAKISPDGHVDLDVTSMTVPRLLAAAAEKLLAQQSPRAA